MFNIINAANFIDKKIRKEEKINEETILKLHELVMKDIGKGGVFRKESSAIFNNSGIVVYFPPPPSEIKKMLREMLNFVNSEIEKFPLITAFIAHLVFEKIHPFLDGNGRVGRLLVFTILRVKSYDFGITIPFEKYLDEHKSEYYYHLDLGFKKTEDYLSFMLGAVYQESNNLLKKIAEENSKEEDLYLLPPRQEEIVRIVRDHISVSLDFLKRRFPKVPARTLRYDLKKLQEKGFLIKTGITKGSYSRVSL